MLTARLVSEAIAPAGIGPAGVVVRDLGPGGVDFALDAGRDFAAASMIKVPIAAALTQAWARGRCRPSDRLRISEDVLTENDAASPFTLGVEATMRELARLMLVRSDNVATNALIDALDRRWIGEAVAELGLRATVVRRKLTGGEVPVRDPGAEGRNAHPPEDAARLFAAIATGRFEGAAWLEETLAAQEWNDKLNAGLRPGDRFAHKTGDTSEASHDGGILRTEGGARLIVVVYTALPSSADSDLRLGAAMRALRPLLPA